MSQALETQQDFWNPETIVQITKLEVLPAKVKRMDEDGGSRVAAGQLFTAVVLMTTENGNNIEVSVTGYLRATLDMYNPRAWMPSDCFAPRKHNNGIPPVRLLNYPRNLCSNNGNRMATLELSQLIANQLGEDNNWREYVCSKVPAVTAELIASELGLEPPTAEPVQAEEEIEQSSSFEEQAHDETENTAAEESAKIVDEDFNFDDEDASLEEPETAGGSTDTSGDLDDDLNFDDLGDVDDNLSMLGKDIDQELSQMDETLAQYDGDDHLSDEPETLPAQSGHIQKSQEKTGFFQRLHAVSKGMASVEQAVEDHPTETKAAEPSKPTLANAPDDKPASVAPAAEPEATPVQEAPAPTPAPAAEETASQPAKVTLREYELFHADGFDVAFFGREHGETTLIDERAGSMATLYTTKAGRLVLHIDGQVVEDFPRDEAEKLYNRLGYSRDAKRLYRSADINCVRHLD